jgi:hypothetical protein
MLGLGYLLGDHLPVQALNEIDKLFPIIWVRYITVVEIS